MISNIVVVVVNGLKPQYKPHPTTIPMISDRFTSFVIRLIIIAKIGGTNAQNVASIYLSLL